MRPLSMALLGLAACTSPGTVVPVIGDARAMAGEWRGTYSSDETGRTGSIVFTLAAGADSAFGDVVMIPVTEDLPPAGRAGIDHPHIHRLPQVLTISLVQCGGGEITGRRDVYQDPTSGHRAGGKWEVTRKAAP